MQRAVLFVDDPITPLPYFETRSPTAQVLTELPVWRVHLVARRPGQVVRHSTPDGVEHAEIEHVWERWGQPLRTIAAKLTSPTGIVYLYALDASDQVVSERAHWDEESFWIVPSKLSLVTDVYRRIPPGAFPDEGWWPGNWASGAAVFFDSPLGSAYERRLLEALNRGDFWRAQELMLPPRRNRSLLRELMPYASLYLRAYFLETPDSSDPWFYFPRRVEQQRVLAVMREELNAAGFEVLLSRRIREFYEWQWDSVLPSDAAPM